MVCAGRDKEEGAGLLKGGGKGEKMEIHTDSKTDTWKLGDHTFTSRFILGSGKYSLELIRAGLPGSRVDREAREIIEKAGYGDCFGHGLGHSVGLYIHEEPRLSPGDDTILEPGMIETVEPGIYVPGFGGVRIEDMVAVTEEGCENLTHSPKELMEL